MKFQVAICVHLLISWIHHYGFIVIAYRTHFLSCLRRNAYGLRALRRFSATQAPKAPFLISWPTEKGPIRKTSPRVGAGKEIIAQLHPMQFRKLLKNVGRFTSRLKNIGQGEQSWVVCVITCQELLNGLPLNWDNLRCILKMSICFLEHLFTNIFILIVTGNHYSWRYILSINFNYQNYF